MIRGEAGKEIPAGLFAPADIVAKLGKAWVRGIAAWVRSPIGGEGEYLDSGFHRMLSRYGPPIVAHCMACHSPDSL